MHKRLSDADYLQALSSMVNSWKNVVYTYYFRNPNTPVKLDAMSDIEWPSYDAHHGKYFAFEKSASTKSVRSNFCAESYGFWYQLIPKFLASLNHHHAQGQQSYFKRELKDSCESREDCAP